MKKTISQKIIEEMEAKGHRLLGRTSGTYSFRKGSNMMRRIESLGMSEDDVIVKTGARAGRYLNDGYELLIFSFKGE